MIYSRSKATFKDNYRHFFIIIQKPQKKDYVDPIDLFNVQMELKTRFLTMQVYKSTLELGKGYRQLHLHILLRLLDYVRYKNNSMILGMRLYWRPIYDLNGVDHYLAKDTVQYTQHDIKNLNYYNHYYGFI